MLKSRSERLFLRAMLLNVVPKLAEQKIAPEAAAHLAADYALAALVALRLA